MQPLRRLAALGAVVVFTLGACTSAATPSPPPTEAPTTAAPTEPPASAPASESAMPSEAPSPTSSVVATVPEDQLVVPSKLTICSDLPYPPLEYFDDQGNPIGSDIEIGQEIAARLGLTATIENTVFDTIIAALQGGKCDVIISDQNITSARIKQVDMLPYFQAGQAFVVDAGNPKAINTTDDLCGKTIAAETGTTEVDYLEGTHDYKGQGLTQACTGKGLAAIDTKEFEKDSDAALALQAGQVDAYFADFPVAANYANTKPDVFALSPIPQLAPTIVGMSVLPDEAHKGLEMAIQTALISMINDGTYLNILKKYQTDSGAITADQASQINKLTLP